MMKSSAPKIDPAARWRRHISLLLTAISFLLPFVVYLSTLAPTLSWRNEGRDGGDLVSAICTLGIPHPPGYPLYVLLGRVFMLLPFGDAAYRTNLMSAFFAAAAVATLFLAVQSLASTGAHPFGSSPRIAEPSCLPTPPPEDRDRTMPAKDRVGLVAMMASLAFAFSPTLWSQATVAEVYTLSAFLTGLTLCLVIRLPHSPGTPHPFHLFTLGLTAGLGLANHFTIAIWLVAIGLWLVLQNPAWLWRSSSIALLASGILVGLSVYLYLPLRAAAHPAANWGAPEDLRGFLWMVTAEPYRRLAFTLPLRTALGRIPTMVSLLAEQFGWIGVALGLGGIWVVSEVNPRFLAFSLAAFLGTAAYAISYNTVDSFIYLVPSYLVYSLWVALGAASVLQAVRRWAGAWHEQLPGAAAALMFLVPVSSLVLNYRHIDASRDRTAYEFAEAAFAQAAPNAILLVDGDEHTFALWYHRDCVGSRSDVAVLNRALLGFEWYQREARRLYPSLRWPQPLLQDDPVGATIAANRDHYPIYLTEKDAWLMGRFPFSPDGGLYRLEAQE